MPRYRCRCRVTLPQKPLIRHAEGLAQEVVEPDGEVGGVRRDCADALAKSAGKQFCPVNMIFARHDRRVQLCIRHAKCHYMQLQIS